MTDIDVVAGGGWLDFGTVRHLRIQGSNRQIGQALAQAAHHVHGPVVGPHRAARLDVQQARRRWFDLHHPVLADRMRGVGDAFGLDPDCDAWDFGMLSTYEVPAGCSAAFYPAALTKDGRPLLARNFDFPTATYTQVRELAPIPAERPLAADPWIVELHPDDGYSSLVVGIMDVMGGMDGINSAGLVVTLLADDESPAREASGRPQVGLSEQQIVRYLLDTCANVDEAKQALLLAKQYYFFVPCHFLVADAFGDAFVWEYSPGHNIEHIIEADSDSSGHLVCTNHLLHRWPRMAQLPNDAGSGIAGRTFERWRALDREVTSGGVVDLDTARAQLGVVAFTEPEVGVRTLWNAVYDLEMRSLDISFFLHDRAGMSHYSPTIHFTLD